MAARGHLAAAAPATAATSPELAWLSAKTRELRAGCQVRAADGTVHYTPEGQGNYRALWARDFTYMVENAGDLLPPEHVEVGLRYLIRGIRAGPRAPGRRGRVRGRAGRPSPGRAEPG